MKYALPHAARLAGLACLGLAAPAGAQVSHYGSGCTSASGITPTIDVGTPVYENAAYLLKLGGPANTPSVLVAGITQISLDLTGIGAGCTLLVDPILVLPVTIGADGTEVLPQTGGSVGQSVSAQHFVFDFKTGELAASDGLELTVQPPPAIDSISITSGGADAEIVLAGSSFPPNPQKDVCAGLEGGGLLTPEVGDSGSMTLKIQPYGTDPQAGPVCIMVGEGEYQMKDELPPPPPGLIDYPDLRILQGVVDPASSAASGDSFTPAPPTPGFTSFSSTVAADGTPKYALKFTGNCDHGDCLKVWMRIWQEDGSFTDVWFTDPDNGFASKTLPICLSGPGDFMDPNECALWACGWTKASLKDRIEGIQCKVVGDDADTVEISVASPNSPISKLEGGYWVQKGGCSCPEDDDRPSTGGGRVPTSM
ncbi:MAG: hypothetical protein AAF682_26275 [Planctomycetota bacterium]